MNIQTIYEISDFRKLLAPDTRKINCQTKRFHGLMLRAHERQWLADYARREKPSRDKLVSTAICRYA